MGIELNVNVAAAALATVGNTSVAQPLNGTTGMIDLLKGTEQDDFIHGYSGNDRIWGGKGVDTIWGDAGDDILYGDAGRDNLYGGTGNDSLWGGEGDDTLEGNGDNDFLRGGTGDDDLYGGTGNDVLRGDEGDDDLYGEAGEDQFRYSVSDLQRNMDFGRMFGNDTIKDFQQGADKIDLRDFFARMSDADVDKFLAMLDVVDDTGVDRDDYENYKKSSKTYYSDEDTNGTSTQDKDSWSFGVESSKQNGDETTTLFLQNMGNNKDDGASITFDGIRELKASDFLRETSKLAYGTEHNDETSLWKMSTTKSVIYHGLDGDDKIAGTQNSDQIWGDNGKDEIHGGAGEDQIWGGAGNDGLFGDAGHDVIYGGTGDDRMWGGSGNDTFVIGGKVTQGGQFDFDQGQDTIEDFELGRDTNGSAAGGDIIGGDRIRFADIFSSGNLGQSNTNGANFKGDWFDKHVEKGANGVIIHEKASVGGHWDATDDHVTIKSQTLSVDDVFNALKEHQDQYFTFG